MAASSKAGGRRLLLAGFGGLLLLMLVAGVDAVMVLREVRSSDAQERNRYLRRAAALDRVRTGIYQSAIVMRAYLLADEPGAAATELEAWRTVRRGAEEALAECTVVLNPAVTPQLQSLRAEVQVYWKLLDFLTTVPEKDRRILGGDYLSREVVQRRGETLDLVDRIDQLNAIEMSAGDAKLNQTFNQVRLRLVIMLTLTFAVGVALAAFTIRRTLGLEQELEQRYQEGVGTRQELQDLSARLVLAQEEERRTISRELHDEVGQSLSALLVEAGNAAARVSPDSTEVRRHVESIKRLAEASVNVIRNMSLLLRPSMLDDLGLVPALEWQAREVSKRTGLRVHVNAEENAGELPDQLRTCIYRVVQEALHNCARHSQARNVRVIVRQEAHKIVLSVEDDGHGFEAGRVRGLGMIGMEERVTHLGGAFEVQSRPGGGTRGAAGVPLAS